MTREEELIRKTGQGDSAAMEELISIYYPEMLRYCLWHAPNRDLAEDAAQETFLKMIRYFNTYTHSGNFRAFLYRIAANVCADMRKRKWMTETSLENSTQVMAYTEQGFAKADEDLQLLNLVRDLDVEMKEVVLLRFGQDLTLKEIAKVLHLPMRTVQSRLRRALKHLRTSLENQIPDSERSR